MSYEIIYGAGTIKQENKYFPIVIWGSNNCTEFTNGRERRERNYCSFSTFHKDWKTQKYPKLSFNKIEDIEKNTCNINKSIEGGSIQGKYKSTKSLINAFKTKIIQADQLYRTCRVTSSYYAHINKKDSEKITELKWQHEYQKLLTIKQQLEATKKFIEVLKEKGISEVSIKKFKKYHGDNCYSNHVTPDVFLQQLKYITPTRTITRKTLKEYKEIAEKGINLQEYGKDKNLREIYNYIFSKFSNKQVAILKQNQEVIHGRLKVYNEEPIIMIPRSRRRYHLLSWNSVLKINSIGGN